MRKYIWLPIVLVQFSSNVSAQKTDTAILSKIRNEALHNSQVMQFAEEITETSGSRLTNSPGFFRAAKQAVTRLQSFGLQNVHLEPWGNFGRSWSMENCVVSMQLPYYLPMIAYPLAWTASTNGTIDANVFLLSSLEADSIKKYADDIRGKIVLTAQAGAVLRSPFSSAAVRYTDSDLLHMPDKDMLTKEQLDGMMQLINGWKSGIALLQKLGCVAVLNMSGDDRDGTVSASAWFSGKKGLWPNLPVFNMAPEHYLLIQRLLQRKERVSMRINSQTKFYDQDTTGYNVIGEIPGSDPILKNEVVMIGAHLDSWYSGTGATDNAAGSAVMMETMRVIKSLHLRPARTIRIALWGGEEQGLLGSYGYVRKHFGNPETMQLLPEQENISAYYNYDNGTGKIRGIFLQNNTAAAPVFENWFSYFSDLDAKTVSLSNTGSTDHLSFDAVGIPAFQFIQDPMEYETRTHHTNMDTFDHLFPNDLKQSVAIITSLVYETAMRKHKIPRKPLPKASHWLFNLFQ